MRVEMGSARGLSQRSMLAYLFLASRVVAWNLVCVSAVMFIVRGRDGNPTANVTAMWALAVGVWTWTVESSAGRVDRLKVDVSSLHGDRAQNTLGYQRFSTDLALIVGAATAVLLLGGKVGADIMRIEESDSC